MMPVAGRVTFPSLIIISTTALTVSIGIANPMPVTINGKFHDLFITDHCYTGFQQHQWYRESESCYLLMLLMLTK